MKDVKFKKDQKVIWNSTDINSQGELFVKIHRVPDDSEYDYHDVGQMYEISYTDGGLTWAYEDELREID